jgi:hypothetical protein
MQGSALPSVDCYPQPVMAWTEKLYAPAFAAAGCPDFKLRENGAHHTSSFESQLMSSPAIAVTQFQCAVQTTRSRVGAR